MQDAISSHRIEKEARAVAEKLQVSLSGELEKVREEKLVVEQRVRQLYNLFKSYKFLLFSLISLRFTKLCIMSTFDVVNLCRL